MMKPQLISKPAPMQNRFKLPSGALAGMLLAVGLTSAARAQTSPASGISLKSYSTPETFDLSGSCSAQCGASYDEFVTEEVSLKLQRNWPRLATGHGLKALIWIDGSGVIKQVQLVKSGANPALDNALKKALLGLQLAAPPPSEPQPILMSLNGEQTIQ